MPAVSGKGKLGAGHSLSGLFSMPFDYAPELQIREDLPGAYRRAFEIIAGPGNWWTAQERIAIAQESRNARECDLCAQRKQALSPNAVDGQHASSTSLEPAVVDVVHRIITDANRLSKRWLDDLGEQGISDGHYVELLGIVVAMISIDEFHAALGLPPRAVARCRCE